MFLKGHVSHSQKMQFRQSEPSVGRFLGSRDGVLLPREPRLLARSELSVDEGVAPTIVVGDGLGLQNIPTA